ncbi:nitroreductase family protein [Phreatobacter sp. AB_2022a]|uniref:nitroreductase family protein n=1 Tax=Phreatobacter sp. AB_2022a TaxID=3003134 RepID=UPI00228713BA|nr:nitroreductase [Phreatobacter sp. AB_2022a]MCZ0734113.1 nitroreductase [Phreatobacter sp. AB_2022a]
MPQSDLLIEHLKTRRSTPFPLMAEPGPDPATLDAMLAIAARVPDHGKLAPWRFIVIDRAAGARLGAFLADLVRADDPAADARKLEIETARFSRAPVCVAIVSRAGPHVKIPEWEQLLSAGAVGLNLLHAAAAFGFGGNWVTEWPAYDRRVQERLGLATHEKIAGFVHIGTPTARAEDRVRPDMAAIVTRFEG